MFRFEYTHTDYTSFLREMAKALGLSVSKNNTLNFNDQFASGYFKAILLPCGIDLLLVDYTTNQEGCLLRKSIKEEIYTLRCDEVIIPDNFLFKIDKDYITQKKSVRSAAILTSSLFDLLYMADKGTKVRSVNMTLTPDWINDYLGIKNTDAFLQKYISMRTAGINMQPLGQSSKKGIEELLALKQDDPLYMAKAERRAMDMVERFFNKLKKSMSNIESASIKHKDIYNIIAAEAMLTKSFISPPTIEELSVLVKISPTKLKKQFKEVYGVPIYTYFQKNRMMKAKELLLSGNHSVKEVGMDLGYSNLGNFASAFKKEFNILPSEVA